MFSIKTRRRIVMILIVFVYAGLLFFSHFVLSAQMRDNSADLKTLNDAATALPEWLAEGKNGTLVETEAHLLAQQELAKQAANAYETLKDYYKQDDDILDRPSLLNRSRPDRFRLDYLSLAESWNAIARRRYGRDLVECIAISPSYEWVTEASKLPENDELAEITKTTCVIDTVVRLLATERAQNGGFVVTAITLGKPRKPTVKLSSERAKALAAPRYTIRPVTVTCEVPYSSHYRNSLARIVTSPRQSAKAPTQVTRNPTTGLYLPREEKTYTMPPVRIRSLSLQPAAINSATVIMDLDIYDFEWKDEQ